MQHDSRSTVLVIEPDTSLRRLIALGLEHRGMQVIEVSSLAALADQPIADPDLLVLDIDNGYRDDTSLLEAVQHHPYLSTLPMVVLAWERVQFAARAYSLPLREYLAKPFDARMLHATIENLLETSAAIEISARRGIVPNSTASIVSSAGISPLLTAAGLLLVVIGLMLQLLIAGAGLLVMLAGLLWWTLGKRPTRQVVLGEVGQKYSPSLSSYSALTNS
ncbi:MAG TPA: response regulator [Ktedonobacteraceae bacterium]